MNTETGIAIVIISLIVLANVAATHLAISNEFSERGQKCLQAAIIWILPGIGAATVCAVLRGKNSQWSGNYPAETVLGEDPNFGLSNASNDYFQDEHPGG
ncbi:hypothetical protein AAKU55_003258 [Oxalobacteraceae bacterium GrIS 1.11]